MPRPLPATDDAHLGDAPLAAPFAAAITHRVVVAELGPVVDAYRRLRGAIVGPG
jgi:hypothetical protein